MERFLTDHDCSKIDRLFAELDVNGNGFITHDELRQLFRACPQKADALETVADVELVLRKLDFTGDGQVSLAEFRSAMLAQQREIVSRLLWPVFDHIDINKSGNLKASEIAEAYAALVGGAGGSVSVPQAQAILTEHDISGDGVLEFDEVSGGV